MNLDETLKYITKEWCGLEFKDYAKGLAPFIPYGKTDADLFVSIVGNFLQDAAIDNCKSLNYKPDTQYRYINGSSIPKKEAEYLYKYRDTQKYSHWISEGLDETDSYVAVQSWLKANGYPGIYPDDECAQALEEILGTICGTVTIENKTPSAFEKSLKLIEDIDRKIQQLPKPTPVPVPQRTADVESPFIQELYAAYGDAENITDFAETNLIDYPEYVEDLDDRRIDFYAAVTIERGVMELDSNGLSNQFDVLKQETLTGVKDTARKPQPNGYERMLSVMEQAIHVPLNNYMLSKSPYWISGNIKKGVCHHLVNDGKLKWVKKRNGRR